VSQPSSITAEVFLLCVFLSITWGIYLAYTIREQRRAHRSHTSRQVTIATFRRVLVALNLWLLPFAFAVRTGLVLLGAGDESFGQVVFFALTGTNIGGSLFAVISLRYD
jgi:hypothetical protein